MLKTDECILCGDTYYPTQAKGMIANNGKPCCVKCNGKVLYFPVKVAYRNGSTEVLMFDTGKEADDAVFHYSKLTKVKRSYRLSNYIPDKETHR